MQETTLFGPRVVGVAVFLYVLLVVAASFHFNISLTPDRVIVLLLIAALGTGRVRSFLKDWSMFAVVILAWQVLQGMSHSFSRIKPHVTEMIVVDKFLFGGHIPTTWLQGHLYHPGHLAWYDIGATMLYAGHFVFPLGVAFALWFWHRDVFMQFMGSFLLLALAGFATFVLFPAAPPWIAANWWHYFPHVYRILTPGFQFFGNDMSFSSLYVWMWNHGGWDVFGAVPSEHAAFPFLCFLYARKAWPRAGWVLLPYCFGVWCAVVYLGEHYVADVIVGVLYATVAYAGVQFTAQRRTRNIAARPAIASVEDTRVSPASDRLPA
ncbi:MAG: hypothetical protein NVSMB52_07350 [Chloroflexota bacterium]